MNSSRDKQPADIHVLDERWVKAGKKNRGSQGNKKEYTGIYQDHSNPKRKVLVKKDDVVARDIAELIASRLWEFLNPDMPGLSAEAQPILVNGQTRPDPKGDNVYLTSLLYDSEQYKNICDDAFNAYHHASQGKTKKLISLHKPVTRPAYHESNYYTNQMLLAGRYPGMERLAVISAYLDDVDFHGENIGTVPVDPSETPITLQYLNGKEDFYTKVRPVRIDYGWAFGGTRRKLDKMLHLFDFFRYVAPGEPLNYFRTYPKEFFYSPEFVQELIRLSCFPEDILASGLKKIVQEVTSFYGRQPLLEYCEWIGVTDYMRKERRVIIDESTDRDSLISYINVFMQVMLLARLQSAEENARKIARSLNITEEEFNYRKMVEKEKFNQLFSLNQEVFQESKEKEKEKEADIACITTKEYKEDERKLIFDPKVAVTHMLLSVFETQSAQSAEEMKKHLPLLLETINLGVSSYMESAENLGNWMKSFSSSTRKEKEAARLMYEMLNDDARPLDQKIIAVCGVLAHHNKFSTLRQCIINELKSYVGQKAHGLPEVLMSLLVKGYGYEEVAVNNKIKHTPIFDLLKEQEKQENTYMVN